MGLSIQDWGALGELIGSIAVIVSLIYLAAQIRLNTRATYVATLQEIQRDWRQINEPADSRISVAVQKERDGEELTPNERFYLRSYFLRHMRTYENLWYAHHQGQLPDALFEGYMAAMPEIMRLGRNQERWSRYREELFHPDFVTYANDALEHGKGTPADIYD